jgi:hypothetical protein
LIDVDGVPVNPRQWVTLAPCGAVTVKSAASPKH